MASPRLHLLLGTLLCYAAGAIVFAKSSLVGMRNAIDARRNQIVRLQEIMGVAQADAQGAAVVRREAPITFSNPKAQDFYVDGTKIPDGRKVWTVGSLPFVYGHRLQLTSMLVRLGLV